jgi:hypothetical protein
MNIKRKEILVAAFLAVLISLSVFYVNTQNNMQSIRNNLSLLYSEKSEKLSEEFSSGAKAQQRLISETIEGEIERGAFEQVVNKLEMLTQETDGYVKSLSMTYQDQTWNGFMICKVPSLNVTSFTFGARAIIDDNGTVTYINISVEYLEESQQGQESAYSTINFNLRESKPESKVELGASLGLIWSILATSLWWIAQGIIVGVPLCFASLGVVILVNRGLIPLWRNMLKKPK